MLRSVQERDWIGTWYELLEQTGEFCGIRFGRWHGGQAPPAWSFLPHKQFDGIGGFGHLLRSHYPGASIDLPQLKRPTPPSLYRRTSAFFRHVKKKRSVSSFSPVSEALALSAEPPRAVAWVVVTQEGTNALEQSARQANVSLNSLLLWALSRATQDELAPGQDRLLWTVPVNMRGGVAPKPEASNHASFIELLLRQEESPQTVHEAVRMGFEKDDHWGAWLALSFGRIIGIKGMRRRLERHGRLLKTGVFSNLGSWNVDEQARQNAGPGRWLFSPPAFRTHPVAAGALVFNGELSLTLQLHEGLSTSQAHAHRWLTRWLRNLDISQDATAAA